MSEKIECAGCARVVCSSEHFRDGPSNCPTKTKAGVIKRALREYDAPEVKEFARQASLQEAECYMNMPEGLTTRYPRVEEVV